MQGLNFADQKLPKAYVLYRKKTVSVCLKKKKIFRGLLLFFNFFHEDLISRMASCEIFRRDLISRFFLNPLNLSPAKFNPLKIHKYKQFDSLSSPDIRAALENVHKDFVVVPIDKAIGNIALICKLFYASVIAKELGWGNNNTADTYK